MTASSNNFRLEGCESVAVISDIHANATALRAVLEDVRERGADAVLMLGDLLGYGPDVTETCELIDECAERFDVRMIRGNHDQIYMELEEGHSPYLAKLGDWLKESSQWTARQIERPLSSRYDWHWKTEYGELHAHHANPFEDIAGHKDWTYLNHDEQILKAAEILKKDGAKAGIFGHNHRALLAKVSASKIERETDVISLHSDDESTFVLNPGSVGQPRSSEGRATFMIVDENEARLHRVAYDVDQHLGRIEKMNVSEQTKTKLKGFFERARAGTTT